MMIISPVGFHPVIAIAHTNIVDISFLSPSPPKTKERKLEGIIRRI